MFAAAKYGLLRKMSYNKNDKKILYKNHKCFSIFLNNKKQQLHSKRQPQVLSFPTVSVEVARFSSDSSFLPPSPRPSYDIVQMQYS